MISLEQAFLQVVEAGSFKKAAEHLNIEASSLSRKISALESRLKVKLLYRSTTKTQPTEFGQTYYNGLRRIVDEQMALEEEIISGVSTIKGKLRIGSTVDLSDQFIVPVIQSMQKQAPELSIELILGSDIDDLAKKNLDIAIRIGPLTDSSLIAKPLGNIPRVLVASPEYLETRETPKTPEDLIDHNFVLYFPAQIKTDIDFLDGTNIPYSKLTSNITVNSLRSIHTIVKGGAGIHCGPSWLYCDDLKAGKLVQILSSHPVTGFSVSAVYASRSFLPKKTSEFIAQISKQIENSRKAILELTF
ncbi:MAG: LysR family transcriptional regulator [Xanthomonadales bacterium]|nr:LysR family transcriptional regulator [Xanthomonadales bacterium]